MNRHFVATFVTVAAVLALTSAAGAQPEIEAFVIAGGGGTSTGTTQGGSVITLSGTIGQCDAGPEMTGTLAGGSIITLTGGCWPVVAMAQTPPPCSADFNRDGFLNPDDLADFITCFFLQAQFPGVCPEAEFNGDGFVNPDDLADFITAF